MSCEPCKFLQYCPIWTKFNENLSYIWIKQFCKGDKQCDCARLALKNKGEAVPLTLLPDGSRLPDDTFDEI